MIVRSGLFVATIGSSGYCTRPRPPIQGLPIHDWHEVPCAIKHLALIGRDCLSSVAVAREVLAVQASAIASARNSKDFDTGLKGLDLEI